MVAATHNFGTEKVETFLTAVKDTVPLWVMGTEEFSHQNGLINVFQHLSSANQQFEEASSGLALLAWQQNPLDRAAAIRCMSLNDSSCPPALISILQTLINSPASDIPLQDLDNLLQAGDQALIIRHLFPLLRGPDGLSWLTHAWDTLLRMGNAELPRTALDLVNWNDNLIQLKQRLKTQYNFLYGSPEETFKDLEGLDHNIWSLWQNYMRSELLLRSGQTEEGTDLLAGLWKNNIWNLNWGQKLHGLLNPIETSNALNRSDEVAILLYSWNNGQLIENTLKNVAASNIGNARIFALNNGSDDSTGQVINEAQYLFKKGHYKPIHLQVNVGAPAARNWLLAEPEVRKAKWAVFLDDDVELEPNWLEELLATAQAYNNPGAVGCRITSTGTPRSLQSADYHLFPPGNGTSQIEGLTEHLMVFDSCRNGFDYGQFSYTRPAMHVSGCCHMLNMEAIHQCGDFDVRFNPTQFDDLERDLRATLGGYEHVYAGQLRIGHIQHSSLAKASNVRSMAQVFGNKIKLESKYSEHDLSVLFGKDMAMLWQDVDRKWKKLAEVLSPDS
ncbi:glycosyltransferase family 2 protein [Desulfovibrio sp. JC022]|uniref:glycosyltransferase family 2 protein n=1 Tax=Desulfovibrio sp. JC022 TaxID=2593642 RepID=UPI0013D2C97B|nr:glycosyltransferase family 2 protein [Desulfovibrio sp. JC022]NDV22691.1 glycosyltransferase family 2 protein [Desulfovibrio sp. JC022]